MNKKLLGILAVLVALSQFAFAEESPAPMDHTMHLQMPTPTMPQAPPAPVYRTGKPFKTRLVSSSLIRKAPSQSSVDYQAIGKNEMVTVLGARGRWLLVELPLSAITGKPQKGFVYGKNFTQEAVEKAGSRFGEVKPVEVAEAAIPDTESVTEPKKADPIPAPSAEAAQPVMIEMAITKDVVEIQDLRQKLAVAEQQLVAAEI